MGEVWTYRNTDGSRTHHVVSSEIAARYRALYGAPAVPVRTALADEVEAYEACHAAHLAACEARSPALHAEADRLHDELGAMLERRALEAA